MNRQFLLDRLTAATLFSSVSTVMAAFEKARERSVQFHHDMILFPFTYTFILCLARPSYEIVLLCIIELLDGCEEETQGRLGHGMAKSDLHVKF